MASNWPKTLPKRLFVPGVLFLLVLFTVSGFSGDKNIPYSSELGIKTLSPKGELGGYAFHASSGSDPGGSGGSGGSATTLTVAAGPNLVFGLGETKPVDVVLEITPASSVWIDVRSPIKTSSLGNWGITTRPPATSQDCTTRVLDGKCTARFNIKAPSVYTTGSDSITFPASNVLTGIAKDSIRVSLSQPAFRFNVDDIDDFNLNPDEDRVVTLTARRVNNGNTQERTIRFSRETVTPSGGATGYSTTFGGLNECTIPAGGNTCTVNLQINTNLNFDQGSVFLQILAEEVGAGTAQDREGFRFYARGEFVFSIGFGGVVPWDQAGGISGRQRTITVTATRQGDNTERPTITFSRNYVNGSTETSATWPSGNTCQIDAGGSCSVVLRVESTQAFNSGNTQWRIRGESNASNNADTERRFRVYAYNLSYLNDWLEVAPGETRRWTQFTKRTTLEGADNLQHYIRYGFRDAVPQNQVVWNQLDSPADTDGFSYVWVSEGDDSPPERRYTCLVSYSDTTDTYGCGEALDITAGDVTEWLSDEHTLRMEMNNVETLSGTEPPGYHKDWVPNHTITFRKFYYEIDPLPGPARQIVTPGETKRFTIDITRTHGTRSPNVRFGVYNADPGWEYKWTNDDNICGFTADGKCAVPVMLDVTPPASFTSGFESITIMASSTNAIDGINKPRINIVMTPEFSFEITDHSDIEMDPVETRRVNFIATRTAGDQEPFITFDTVRPPTPDPAVWTQSWVSGNTCTISSAGLCSVQLDITTPASFTGGSARFRVDADSSTGADAVDDVFDIISRFKFSLLSITDQKMNTAETVDKTIRVRKLQGTNDDDVTLNWSFVKPPGLTLTWPDGKVCGSGDYVDGALGDACLKTLRVAGDGSIVSGDYTVTITAEHDTSASQTETFDLTVRSGCNDGADNDGDELIDEEDPGCYDDPGGCAGSCGDGGSGGGGYDPGDNDESTPASNLTLGSVPPLVNPGSSATITWSARNVLNDSCRVTSTDTSLGPWNQKSGTRVVVINNPPTKFTLECTDLQLKLIERATTIQLNPFYIES